MATRWDRVPDLTEDVLQRSAEDVGKVGKGMGVGSSNLKGAARDVVKEAGARAASRLLTRAGLTGGALQTGYDIGRAIDESTGIGKKLVNKLAGSAIDKMAAGEDQVELSKEAKARIERGDLESSKPMQESVRRRAGGKRMPGDVDSRRAYEEGEGEEVGYKKGGKVSSASKRADGIAQRGRTRGTIVACGGGYMKGKR